MDSKREQIGAPEDKARLNDGVVAEDDNSDIIDISSQIREDRGDRVKSVHDTSVQSFTGRKKKKWVKVVIILLIVAAVIGFIAYRIIVAKNKMMELLSAAPQEAEIVRMDITSGISATGTIQSKDVRTLTSPLSGVKIDEVNYEVGDMVQQGSVVVTFSREDINKKIGQLEEDITEAKQTKALDAGDRTNTYVNNADLQTYNVATSYENLKRMETDLQKAKDELQRVCDQKAEYKALYEEAKEKRESVQAQYDKKTAEKLSPDYDTYSDEKKAKLEIEINDLYDKLTRYRNAIDNYDTNIKNYEDQEKLKFDKLDSAQRNYDDALVAFNKSGYDASFNNAKSEYNLNMGNLKADDSVKTLERQKEQSEDSLDDYIVTAPISGLVTSVNAQEGNGYVATQGALMTIQAVDVLEVATQIDEYDINNVQIGQRVVIMTDATGEDELEGLVTFVAPVATIAPNGASSNTFEVKIDILHKDDRLRLGMNARLNIIVDTHNNVLAVPYDAIEENENGSTYINVVDENATNASADEGKGISIQVIGMDGLIKESANKEETKEGKLPGAVNSKEIPVQIGLEGDYYTEVISPDIKEGMTVLVNSEAGNLQNDLEALFGGGGQ